MKQNIFEKLYGYLFRNLAKSILSEFDRKKEDEYLTIGILLYRSFDESFYYAPTLKNSLLFPNEISATPFPTSQKSLWNKKLMISFGRFLSQTKIKNWVNELFDENEELATYDASSYATTFDSYKNFRDEWRNWFNTKIDAFSDDRQINLEDKKDVLILNQLFHFGNYIITVTRRAAFISKSSLNERTYAENIYMCISNPQLIKESVYFNTDTGVLEHGNDIQWIAEPRSQERKNTLNFALEVCYRWPFGVDDKIKVLNQIYGHGKIDKTNKQYLMNATATPLLYNGEFLGICYLSQSLPPARKNENFKIGKRSKTLISRIKESSITGFLYNSRFETARIALQKINATTYKRTAVERVFDLCHTYSSSPLVALIDDESGDLFFRYRQGNELVKKMTTSKSENQGSQLIDFLKEQFAAQNFSDERKESYSWFDVYDKLVNKGDKEAKTKAYNTINKFNVELFNFLNPSINFNPEQLKITSVCYLRYVLDDSSIATIVFFNSNYWLLSNSGTSNSLVKKSYALRNHNNIRQLMESDQVHRRLYEQSLSFQENLRKGLLHYFKGSLNHKIKHYLESKVTEESRKILLDNCNTLNERIKNLIIVYNKDFSGQETDLKRVYECWNESIKGYNQSKIFLEKVNLETVESLKCFCNIDALGIIFEEQIQNAFNILELNSKKKLRLELKTIKKRDILTVLIICHGSNMQTKYIEKAGIDSFSSSESSGIGFIITELLLNRSESLKIGKRHFDLKNTLSPKSLKMIFKLKIA